VLFTFQLLDRKPVVESRAAQRFQRLWTLLEDFKSPPGRFEGKPGAVVAWAVVLSESMKSHGE
jgi:hypothetical protein